MVLDAVSNFVRGETDAALDDTETTVSVADASIFPDPATDGEYNVVIWDANNFPRPDQDGDVEIVRVTGRDTGVDELTVVRAQETTSDVAHPSGSAVHLSPTAKMFSDIEAEYTAQGENFDGEGTSEFSNLQSLSTDGLNNADLANADADTVPTSQGDGTLSMQEVVFDQPVFFDSSNLSTFDEITVSEGETYQITGDIINAEVFGRVNLAGSLKVRFDDATEVEFGTNDAETSGGDDFAVVTLPPLTGVDEVELFGWNNASGRIRTV